MKFFVASVLLAVFDESAWAQPDRGMEGDGSRRVAVSRVPPIAIPESESPVIIFSAQTTDGRTVKTVWRRPAGDGPVPVVLVVQGSLDEIPLDRLRGFVLGNSVGTRLLNAGYAAAATSPRSYAADIQSPAPIDDVRTVVRVLARQPGVDPSQIFLYGGSGGGSIVLELASEEMVRAVAAGEPATLIYTGMLATSDYRVRLEMMREPALYFTESLRQRTREKLKTVRVPVLIVHSDQHDLHKFNEPIFLPLMRQAGVKVEFRLYPGYGHGLYFGSGDDRWGRGADLNVVAAVVSDLDRFFRAHGATPRKNDRQTRR